MQLYMYIQINAFSLAVLALIFHNVHHRAGRYLLDQRLFLMLLLSNALILVLDTTQWVLDGRPGVIVWAFYAVVSAFYYAISPLVGMLWLTYVDFQIFRDEHHLRKEWAILLTPAIINGVFSFLSVGGGYLFYFDQNNVYHRGEFFPVMVISSYFYIVASIVLVISNRKRIPKRNLGPLLLVGVPPFVGGIVQSLCYGTSILWPCMTISTLIIFINIQNDQLYTDHLTGLFNRRQLDYYLAQRAQNSGDQRLLAGLMIDLDSFKKINDVYGHLAGDQALEYTAKILRKTFRQNDFIARYGGDEFVVIMEIQIEDDIAPAVNRLKENLAQFNAQNLTPYAIGLSIGWDIFDGKSDRTIQEFLQNIDKYMYRDKQKKEDAVLAEKA